MITVNAISVVYMVIEHIDAKIFKKNRFENQQNVTTNQIQLIKVLVVIFSTSKGKCVINKVVV